MGFHVGPALLGLRYLLAQISDNIDFFLLHAKRDYSGNIDILYSVKKLARESLVNHH